MPLRLALALFLAVAGSCAASQPLPSVPLPPELDTVLRDYERAWVAKDPQALSRLFTGSGIALPNGQTPARDSDAIRRAYAQDAGSPLSLRALAYGTSGDLAYVIGGYGAADDQPDFGKFVLVRRRGADGRWLIAADIDNANALPRAASSGAQATAAR